MVKSNSYGLTYDSSIQDLTKLLLETHDNSLKRIAVAMRTPGCFKPYKLRTIRDLCKNQEVFGILVQLPDVGRGSAVRLEEFLEETGFKTRWIDRKTSGREGSPAFSKISSTDLILRITPKTTVDDLDMSEELHPHSRISFRALLYRLRDKTDGKSIGDFMRMPYGEMAQALEGQSPVSRKLFEEMIKHASEVSGGQKSR